MPIPKAANDIGSAALMVDATTGDVWYWFQSPVIGNSKGGSGIIYQGRLVPGTEPGQAVARYGFGEKPVQLSK
jgi:hypothetical protein